MTMKSKIGRAMLSITDCYRSIYGKSCDIVNLVTSWPLPIVSLPKWAVNRGRGTYTCALPRVLNVRFHSAGGDFAGDSTYEVLVASVASSDCDRRQPSRSRGDSGGPCLLPQVSSPPALAHRRPDGLHVGGGSAARADCHSAGASFTAPRRHAAVAFDCR